jgi:hypothetical protein
MQNIRANSIQGRCINNLTPQLTNTKLALPQFLNEDPAFIAIRKMRFHVPSQIPLEISLDIQRKMGMPAPAIHNDLRP